MIVTVPIVLMMQMPVDDIVDVIAVRNRFMTTTRAVHMVRIMPTAIMPIGASIRVIFGNFQYMLINMIAMHMVKMAVVKIISMITMFYSGMPAVGAMLVGMIFVLVTLCHVEPSLLYSHAEPFVDHLKTRLLH